MGGAGSELVALAPNRTRPTSSRSWEFSACTTSKSASASRTLDNTKNEDTDGRGRCHEAKKNPYLVRPMYSAHSLWTQSVRTIILPHLGGALPKFGRTRSQPVRTLPNLNTNLERSKPEPEVWPQPPEIWPHRTPMCPIQPQVGRNRSIGCQTQPKSWKHHVAIMRQHASAERKITR